MKRPSFQFYPADWRNNAKLRRCSEAARGAWIDVLCTLHDSDDYGVLRWPLADVARAAGVPLKLVRELAAKDVLKGADVEYSAYIYTPRHANRNGDPIVLVEPGAGPCWYCSRMVRDEYVRQKRGGTGTQFSSDNQPPKHAPMPPIGYEEGDGPTSTSSSAPKNKGQLLMSSGDDVRQCPSGTLVNLYHDLMPLNPRVKTLNAARKSAIKARWTEASKLDCKPFGYATQQDGIEAWRQFFAVCAESKFLTGLAPAATGKPAFVADIDFLFSPSGFAKTLENKYHRDAP